MSEDTTNGQWNPTNIRFIRAIHAAELYTTHYFPTLKSQEQWDS